MIRIAVEVARVSSYPLVVTLVLGLAACAEGETNGEAAAGADTAAGVAADTTTVVVADTGFQSPESVLHDSVADVYLVSNINGGPLDKDDNGFITRISPDGEGDEMRWIDGGQPDITLHAPKGTAIKGDTLFVADIDSVRVFDRVTGAPLGARGIEGVTFLNDLAVGPDGTLYVTDTGPESPEAGGTAAVYRFGPEGAVALAEGEELTAPNGIVVDDTGAIVAPFGGAQVYRIDDSGARTPVATVPTGQLDGLVRLEDGTLLVSSWEGSAIYRIGTGGEIDTLATNVESPADIGYDAQRRRVLIPLLQANRVEGRAVP